MNYYYYQRVGGNEKWEPIAENLVGTVADAMFVTILSVDTQVDEDTMSREDIASIKYKGPMYFDLDDGESPASTAVNAIKFIEKLEEVGVDPEMLEIAATGGKGFHILVPEAVFMTKPPKAGMAALPHIYKELAFKFAVQSLDLRVYTARRGRMFRQYNLKRENGQYKVSVSLQEVRDIADLYGDGSTKAGVMAAAEMYQRITSEPRAGKRSPTRSPVLSPRFVAEFDAAKDKVQKARSKRGKKQQAMELPESLPSFEAMLRGEGIKAGIGFHPLAMQIGITAHAKGMTLDALIEAAEGLCQNHESDGTRYNTYSRRKAELIRMYHYTEDNPCYTYMPSAIVKLLKHAAPDLRGIESTEEEVQDYIANSNGEDSAEEDLFGHGGVTLASSGAYVAGDGGTSRRVISLGFDNATELVSAGDGSINVIEAELRLGDAKLGRQTFTLDDFQSVSAINKRTMRFGQSFTGTDAHSRGLFMRLVDKARRGNKRMYVLNREGLDVISMPFHEHEDVRKDFLVWSDQREVVVQPHISDLGVQMRFVGWPDPEGVYKSDLSQAPNLVQWLNEYNNRDELRDTLRNLLHCQHPKHLGKLIGWMIACHYRMLFHKCYDQFPLLHVNGNAGSGKTSLTKLLTQFHFYNQEPRMLTPGSTLFAVKQAATGGSSIPLILDEFKPSEMRPDAYNEFKLLLRDAYNNRPIQRGGGSAGNSDYRSIQTTHLSSPMAFIAEAVESEPALMERVVLVTLSKPSVVETQKYLKKFLAAGVNKHHLGIIGNYIVAQTIKRYSLEQFREEFDEIYNQTRKDLMLQEGEEEFLSDADVRRKASAKERTVFNYAVVKFGLKKLRGLIAGIFQEEFNKDFKEVFEAMESDTYSTVEELQEQTVPEWLKVMNTFADMANYDPMQPISLQEGRDYAYVTYNGKECFEIYARTCYLKYRMYQSASRQRPLFPGESAFVHALAAVSCLEARGLSVELTRVPGGSHIFDLNGLRAMGFLAPVVKD